MKGSAKKALAVFLPELTRSEIFVISPQKSLTFLGNKGLSDSDPGVSEKNLPDHRLACKSTCQDTGGKDRM